MDTVEVVVLDEGEGVVAVLNDGGHVPLLLPVHHQRHELVYHRHIRVSPVVARYQHLQAHGTLGYQHLYAQRTWNLGQGRGRPRKTWGGAFESGQVLSFGVEACASTEPLCMASRDSEQNV